MSDPHNPMGREYSRAEVAAARRLDIARTTHGGTHNDGSRCEHGKVLGGPIIWATGPYYPDEARRMARDWALVADAMEREWTKPIPAPVTTGHDTKEKNA